MKKIKLTSYIHSTELLVKGQNVSSSKRTNGIGETRNRSTDTNMMELHAIIKLELSNWKKAIKPLNHNTFDSGNMRLTRMLIFA